MGVTSCEAMVAAPREGCLAAGTASAVTSAAHTPRQRHAFARLATLSATVAAHDLTSRAILVIGDAVHAATELGSPSARWRPNALEYEPKCGSYPGAGSVGGGVGRPI